MTDKKIEDCKVIPHSTKWNRENPEKTKLQKAKYYKKNKVKIKVSNHEHYLKYKKSIRKINKKYYEENKDRLNKITQLKRINRRKEIINYKGNKCSKCGYNKCIQALELHHKNPEEKEFTINNAIMVKNYKFKNIKKEVDKCILVCANCHREIHYTWRIKNDK